MNNVTKVKTDVSMAAINLDEDVKNLPSVPGAMEIQSTEKIFAVRPKHLDDDRDVEIREQAKAIADAVIENPNDIEITAELYGLGQEAEAANSDNIELINAKIAPLMSEVGAGSAVGMSLAEIKTQLDLVNPHVVGQTEGKFEAKFLGFIKYTASRLPKSSEILTIINSRRDTIATTIGGLKEHLWEERDKATKNAIELGRIATRLAGAQTDLQESAYQGQLIWEHINEARSSENDPNRKQSLDYLVTDLATTVVDLQTIDQLNIQSRMGAETLINNCRGLEKLVKRLTNTLLPSVQTALAIKAAAYQQKQLADNARAITASASDTMARTAEDIHHVSVDVAKQNSEAVVDIEKIEEAARSYEQMQIDVEAVMKNAESNCRTITNRMGMLNERMRDVTDPLTAARLAKEAAGV